MEHLLHTPGFTLDFVEYVVVDEADRLLSQVVKRCSKDLLLYYCLTVEYVVVDEADRLLSQVVKGKKQ
jgi:superfamily II DNA/RNA helicase